MSIKIACQYILRQVLDVINNINAIYSFKNGVGFIIMDVVAFTLDQALGFFCTITFIGVVLYKSSTKKTRVIADNLILNNWLQEVEKVEHSAMEYMRQHSEKLDKLCNEAQGIIPEEYQDSFPATWEKTEELARKQHVQSQIPGNIHLGHYLLKTEITKKLVGRIIKDRSRKSK